MKGLAPSTLPLVATPSNEGVSRNLTPLHQLVRPKLSRRVSRHLLHVGLVFEFQDNVTMTGPNSSPIRPKESTPPKSAMNVSVTGTPPSKMLRGCQGAVRPPREGQHA